MRLLQVDSLFIHDFTGRRVPPYAILSHTWGEEEVSFKDMTKGRGQGLKGYEKIQACCRQAQIDCLEYVWIDTCCIDKRSSAELSEAVNSMYCWYTGTQVSYAYLEDVPWPSGSKLDDTVTDQGLPPSFLSSRWFSRGWTLQELIAPPVVIFYSSEWSEIGSRKTLRNTLIDLTGISYDAFDGFVGRCSVAQKMSWASKRKTTRVEDEAYCMLGLFGVSMPLLYGEGRKAFRRLQEGIIKQSDDETIFAWARGSGDGRLLALSPSNFEASGCFECSDIRGGDFYGQSAWNSSPFTVTNKGVQFSLPIIEYQPLNLLTGLLCGQTMSEHERNQVCSLAVVNCHEITRKDEDVAILLNRIKETSATYTRRGNYPVSVPADYISDAAVVKQILISTEARNGDGGFADRWFNPQLIIIQPFPATLASVIMVRILQPDGACLYSNPHFHDNGAISVMSPFKYVYFDDRDHYRQNPLVLVFKTSQGATVLVSISPTPAPEEMIIATISSNDREAEGDWCGEKARRDIWEYEQGNMIAEMPASSPHTAPLKVSTHVRDAEYAWIVTIQVVCESLAK